MAENEAAPSGREETYDRLNFLELRNNQLAEAIKRVESERHYMEAEILRLQREVKRLKTELDRLRYPPLIVGTVRDVLTDGRLVVKSSTGPDFVVNAAETVEHEKISVGSRVALNKQTLAVMGVLPASLDPLVTASEIVSRPGISYEDIGGLGDQIREIREAVEYPLLRGELYRKVGVEPPKGVLLIGPPGTGKTMIAKAVAHHTHATFIRLVGSELVQKYIGEGARLVRELFQLAREKAPTIIFIDEIDSIGAKRLEVATSGDREVQRTLMQLLAEMDGFEPLSNVKITAATNRPDILDEALLRPGRFDRIVEIPVPSFQGRVEIFKIHSRGMSLKDAIDWEALAARCDGSTGADIKSICTEAGMWAIREERDAVNMSDFERAIEKVIGEEDTGKETVGMFA
ncbi:MAG: proteasome-activating nucleotidase [Euryarchaeota archaeon]|nr:proteasome-activating nucleotidase [Euryarchaeota archaeon]MDE1880155.1 proteasome-activating nucleotidase [Euryarchaeota archaeon]MDE2046403.1 proteasome-activating nucleotidase [Thermoplasmata archaeon]